MWLAYLHRFEGFAAANGTNGSPWSYLRLEPTWPVPTTTPTANDPAIPLPIAYGFQDSGDMMVVRRFGGNYGGNYSMLQVAPGTTVCVLSRMSLSSGTLEIESWLYTDPAALPSSAPVGSGGAAAHGVFSFAQNSYAIAGLTLYNNGLRHSGGFDEVRLGRSCESVLPRQAVPAITSAIAVTGRVTQSFSYQATALNNPTGWSATGLPAGLSISTSGLISGTPTTAGSGTIRLTATNAVGADAIDVAYTIRPRLCTITVTDGSGGTTCELGTVLTIQAMTPPVGADFVGWTVDAGSAALGDASATTTAFTCAGDATVRATWNRASLGFAGASSVITESAGSVTVAVRRTLRSIGSVSVDYTIVAGTATADSDYTASASGTLTWTDADTADKTIALAILNDASIEGGETLTLTLGNPQGGAVLGTASHVLTIGDDDAPAGSSSGGGGGGGGGGCSAGAASLLLLGLFGLLGVRRRH